MKRILADISLEILELHRWPLVKEGPPNDTFVLRETGGTLSVTGAVGRALVSLVCSRATGQSGPRRREGLLKSLTQTENVKAIK